MKTPSHIRCQAWKNCKCVRIKWTIFNLLRSRKNTCQLCFWEGEEALSLSIHLPLLSFPYQQLPARGTSAEEVPTYPAQDAALSPTFTLPLSADFAPFSASLRLDKVVIHSGCLQWLSPVIDVMRESLFLFSGWVWGSSPGQNQKRACERMVALI